MVELHRLDLKAEVAGVEMRYDPQPEITVWLARMSNPAMIAWQRGPDGQERLRELKLAHDPAAAQDAWFRESIGRFVVRRWTGLDWNGVPLPFDEEASVRLMLDPRCREWHDWVAENSTRMERFLERDRADAEKNSGSA